MYVSVSQAAIVWEPSSLQDGITIPACADQDVVLNWNYNTVGDERVVNTEWRFTPSGRKFVLVGGGGAERGRVDDGSNGNGDGGGDGEGVVVCWLVA